MVTSRELDIVKVAAALVSAAVLLAGLYYGRDILIPLAIAFLITFALNPPVTWLVRLGLSRLLATSLVMVTVVCALVGLGVILGAQVRSIAIELPAYQSTILTKLSDLRQQSQSTGIVRRRAENGRTRTEGGRVQETINPRMAPSHSASRSSPYRKRRSSRHLLGLCGQRSLWPPPASS